MKKLFIVVSAATLISSASYAGKNDSIGGLCKDIEAEILENTNQLHDIHEASKSKYYNAQQGTKEQREIFAALEWLSTMYGRLSCNRFGGV